MVQMNYQYVVTVCSLYSISRAPPDMKGTLVKSFIDIVLLECRQHLDPAEYECTLLLLSFIVSKVMDTPSGIQTTIDSMYPEFSTITVFGALYVDQKFIKGYNVDKAPSSITEYMMLRSFQGIPSIM